MKGKRTFWTRLADTAYIVGKVGPVWWRVFWQADAHSWALRHIGGRQWYNGRHWIEREGEPMKRKTWYCKEFKPTCPALYIVVKVLDKILGRYWHNSDLAWDLWFLSVFGKRLR